MKEQPLVSVLMPTNSVDKYFIAAINSIINQSYKNIEIIIVANGISKAAWDLVIEQFTDCRIKFLHTEIRKLTFSLNLGLNASTGHFVARMDADDISEINRLEDQINFLLQNPDISVCGSFCNVIDGFNNKIGSISYPIDDKSIRKSLLWRNPFCHPSVVIKRELLLSIGGYDGHHAEDYALWVGLANERNVVFANIPRFLVNYRSNGGGHPRIALSRKTYAMVAGVQCSTFIKTFNVKWLAAALLTALKVISYTR